MRSLAHLLHRHVKLNPWGVLLRRAPFTWTASSSSSALPSLCRFLHLNLLSFAFCKRSATIPSHPIQSNPIPSHPIPSIYSCEDDLSIMHWRSNLINLINLPMTTDDYRWLSDDYAMTIRWLSDDYPMTIRWLSIDYPMTITNFWSIFLDDHWSKKIYRPEMIV